MKRKRKNIPAGVRWDVFQRDDFRCVYCGATKKDGAQLVVDHGDPFSRGGEDSIENFVTACKPCNDGKKAKVLIPPAAEIDGLCCVVRRGVVYANQLHADWADAFRQRCYEVEYFATSDDPLATKAIFGIGNPEQASTLKIDFQCDFLGRELSDLGPINVVIVPWSDIGSIGMADLVRLRDAAVLGYTEPTMLVIGSPWMFFAAVVTDRRKGCPDGFVIDEWLEVGDEFYSSGWYPDESWECVDPRDDFGMRRPTSLSLRGWHITMNDIDMEGSDDI